jgi:hypothetical protein
MTNKNSGIWFLGLSSTATKTGLGLPTLPAGSIYKGWALTNGTPGTMGILLSTYTQ